MGGIEGIVVGMVGSEVDGSGGSATFGMVGIEGKVGIWVLGKGGKANFGRVGPVGGVGKGTAGNGGSVVLGRVGMAGDGGSVGSVGREDCSKWRAARVVWRLESTNATIKAAIIVIWTITTTYSMLFCINVFYNQPSPCHKVAYSTYE
ncbi:hypothetical protein LguiA_005355 [Lonicera macranthoides]